MGDALGEDVVGVLEVGELGAGVGGAAFAGVEDFGAEFGAGGAEEVGFLYLVTRVSEDVTFGVGGKICAEGGWGKLRSRRQTLKPSLP